MSEVVQGQRSAMQAKEPIQIPEWTKSEPIDLTEADLDVLESEEVGNQIQVKFDRNGETTLRSKQFVGILGLPDGPPIEVYPKAAGSNLVHLIRYASGKQLDPEAFPTPAQPGRSIVDTLAALFLNELTTTIRSGMDKSYVDRHRPERCLRGQINLQRQLQRQGPVATDIECDFEELTTDTPLNQAILYATQLLAGLCRNSGLQSDLSLWTKRLRGHVTLRPVEPSELLSVELTRLNSHYEQLVELTRWVLEASFIENLRAGSRRASSLLVNMNNIFEAAVERAAREGLLARDEGWSVHGQERTEGLLIGSPPVGLRPDLVIYARDQVVAVADVKWKTEVKNSDLYQLVAYQRTYDAPGLLFYPSQDGELTRSYRVREGHRLTTVELPTDIDTASPEELGAMMKDGIADAVIDLVDSTG